MMLNTLFREVVVTMGLLGLLAFGAARLKVPADNLATPLFANAANILISAK